MAGIFDIGVSSLLSHQRAITTTGNNIANVNTDGYSRQRVEFDSRLPQAQNYGFVGSGVEITTIERMYDQFAVSNLRTQTALNSDLETYHQFASQIDNLLANPEAGLSPTLLEFFNSVQGVADDPSSIPPRQVMLSQAQSLIDRFNYIYDRMTSLYDAANSQIEMTVDEINSMASSIAKLNTDITLQEGLAGGQPANDLRDQRDELIRELSERVSVTVNEQRDGSLNVFIGTGQSLVVGGRALTLAVTNNEFDLTQKEITLTTGTGSGVLITNNISGGSLGGLLRFDEEILQPAINQLGLIAVGLVETFNAQHNLGQDLNGGLGGDFFDSTVVDVREGINTGGAVVTAVMSDVASLTASDYMIRADGADNYSLVRLSDQSILRTDNITVGNTLTYTVDGVDFTIDATVVAVAGDEFKIRPTRYAARDIDLVLNDPRQIAAASPIRTDATLTNTGTGKISDSVVSAVDLTVLPLSANNGAITLTFDSAGNQFVVTDGAGVVPGTPLAYNPATDSGGVTFTLGAPYDGISFAMSGVPADGDTFTIVENSGGVSDNRNALLLSQIQTTNTLLGGTADLQSTYGQLVAEVGTKTHQADINSKAQNVLLRQAVDARETVSGVNLDEEAANLLKYQQAYQAAAQVITTANGLFETLLNAVR